MDVGGGYFVTGTETAFQDMCQGPKPGSKAGSEVINQAPSLLATRQIQLSTKFNHAQLHPLSQTTMV